MTALHATAGGLAIPLLALYVLMGAALALVARWPGWAQLAHRTVVGLLALQALAGLVLFATGARPAEGIHLVYGIAIAGVPALGATFAADAPPRPRAIVIAIGGLLALLLAWRLAATG